MLAADGEAWDYLGNLHPPSWPDGQFDLSLTWDATSWYLSNGQDQIETLLGPVKYGTSFYGVYEDGSGNGVIRKYDQNGNVQWSVTPNDLAGGYRPSTIAIDPLADNGQPALNFEVTPLTLIARSGLGKSQLLRALAATWARQQQSDGVMLIDATDFARTYATAVKLDDVPRFRQRFQRIGR